jgi:hypothetical protein
MKPSVIENVTIFRKATENVTICDYVTADNSRPMVILC